jgi:glycine betaine/proline transport system substrate-binding protein
VTEIEIKRGYEVLPDNNVRFGIRVINNSDFIISDVEVILDYSESLFDLEGSKIQKLGTIPPAVPRTAKFVIKPLGCIHKEEIAATVRYKDHQWNRHTLEVRPKEVHCVCPFLQEKSITRADFLSLLDSGYFEERGVNFEGITVDKVVDFLFHSCKNRLYKVDEFPIENGAILYLAGDALGEKAYYLLTAVVKEYDGVTQVLLRANSDKSHGLNGFLNEILDNLRHLVLSAEAREIGIIRKEQVINIIDSVVQRTTFAGGEGAASVHIRDSVVHRTEIKEEAEKRRREAEERRAREEAERTERVKVRQEEERLRQEREKRAREEAERKEREREKAREEERRRKEEEARKAREAAGQREKAKAARKEERPIPERASRDRGSSQKKILAVVLVLGAVLAGYWAFAPGSTEAPELIETPTPNVKQTPEIAGEVSRTPAPAPAADQEKTTTNSIGMEFVLIPAGGFEMGSPSGETYRPDHEGPVHRVTIEKAFYMGRYEVTQKEWHEVMGNNPSHFQGDDLPVEKVSWDDVQEFIKKLNEREGTGKYRLPSEAEWEYAGAVRHARQCLGMDTGQVAQRLHRRANRWQRVGERGWCLPCQAGR